MFGKKWMAAVSAVCAAAMLAGCTAAPAHQNEIEPTATPEIQAEQTVYTLAAINWPGAQLQTFTETTVGRKLAAQQGVIVQIEYYTGDTQQLLAQLTQGENQPDMIWADGSWQTLIDQGALADLTDRLNADPDGMQSYYRAGELQAVNGGSSIYVLGTQRSTATNVYTGPGYYLRYDVLEEAGFPQITTLAQYCLLIEDYMAAHKDAAAAGLAVAPGAWSFGVEGSGAFTSVSGQFDHGVFTVDPVLQTVKFTMQSKWLKDWFRVVNDLYAKGCVDKAIFTQTQEEYEQKILQGDVLGFYDPTGELAAKCEEALWESGHNYVAFPVVLNGVERDYCRGPAYFAQGGIAINAACDDVDGVFAFISAMAGDDAQMLNRWGVENVDYSFTEEGRFTRTEEQWQQMQDETYLAKRGIGMLDMFPHREGSENGAYAKFAEGNWTNPEMSDEYPAQVYTAAQQRTVGSLRINRLGELFGRQEYAPWGDLEARFAALGEESPECTALKAALALADEYQKKLITVDDKKLDTLWLEYQDKLDAVEGLAEAEALVQQWIDEALGN